MRVQGGPVFVVGAQCVRLATGAVQREHQQLARPLPQGILAD